ncbi:hypothetical protein ADILRU_2681 [Leifsonia rubra CMS 76R]|nr:hypothetical protein ADILRU_2681 [Leifsonia rubra CMS 76R]
MPIGDLGDRGDDFEQHGLVVIYPLGEKYLPGLVDHDAVMRPLS